MENVYNYNIRPNVKLISLSTHHGGSDKAMTEVESTTTTTLTVCDVTTTTSYNNGMSEKRASIMYDNLSNGFVTRRMSHQSPTATVSNEGISTAAEDDENAYLQNPFYIAFQPLFKSLSLTGLYHVRLRQTKQKSAPHQSSSASFSDRLPTPWQAYCWAVTGLAWIMVIRSLVSLRLFTSIGPDLVYNLVMTSLLGLVAMNATGFLATSHHVKSVKKLFLGFALLDKYGGPFVSAERTRKYVTVTVTLCWAVICTNMVITGVITFKTTTLDILSSDPFMEDGTFSNILIKSFFMAFVIFLTSLWIFPSGIELCISVLLYKEFRAFCDSIKANIDKNGHYLGSIEMDRCRYLVMGRMVRAADNIMALHHGASFSCNIASICLLLYSLLYYPSVTQSTTLIGGYAFWLFGAIVDMTIVCICGILIHSATGRFADKVHKISLQGVTPEFSTQIVVFLDKLRENTGMSVAHLFVIDQTVILTLVGLLLTYFFVIIQFAQQSNAAPSSASCNINSTSH